MANNNIKEIRKMDYTTINSSFKKKSIDMVDEKMKLFTQKKQDFSALRQLKKEIARLYTVRKEKEIING